MLHLIPAVKELRETGETLQKNTLRRPDNLPDPRLSAPLSKLPCSEDGIPLTVTLNGSEGEGYVLDITQTAVSLTAESAAGAFYGLQTLRQIFDNETKIPCLHIEDRPDFAYRGFYHDVTRGKIPTVKTVKNLVDKLAYFKINSLQLYVEHAFEFKETEDIRERTGYLTRAELEEIDAYCRESFIDFIPSLNTFGHMYEILQQPKFRHLRIAEDFQPTPYFWWDRMRHHTIDPTKEGSIELIQSLTDQYAPCFSSPYFNICCDETGSLKKTEPTGTLYVDFVKKIIRHLKSKNKKVMMWADILLEHPETIELLPEDTIFLNWDYIPHPREEKVSKFAELNRTQILCPGTNSWHRFCELVADAEQNISNMTGFAKKYNALGILNTNWGDWGNVGSIEMSEYSIAFGAACSWASDTEANDAFHKAADRLVFQKDGAFDLLSALSEIHNRIQWFPLAKIYYDRCFDVCRPEKVPGEKATEADCQEAIALCKELLRKLTEPWGNEEAYQEMILAVKGVWAMAQLYAKAEGYQIAPELDLDLWLEEYAAAWRRKNKESELNNILDMFNKLNRLS